MYEHNTMLTDQRPGADVGAVRSRPIETSVGPMEVAVFGPDDGAPVILVSHGMGTWESLEELGRGMAAANAHRRVVAWSRPGRGRSPAVSQTDGNDPLIHEAGIALPALMSALGIVRADLLAHSDGATVALLFSALFPDKVDRLVALAPNIYADSQFAMATERLPALEQDSGLSDRLCAHHVDPQSVYEAWIDCRRRHVRSQWSAIDTMPAVTASLLLIQGMDDEFTSPAQLSAIAERVSGPVKWVMLQDQGHFPQHDNPEQILRLVEGHFRRQCGRQTWRR